MKKKLLYLMNVSWGVIKQRQQFIAENLSKTYDVTVYNVKNYRTSQTVKNDIDAQIDLRQLFVLPFGRFKVVLRINALLIKLQLIRAVGKADFVWVSDPLMFEAIRGALRSDAKLVYDCPDDFLEFPVVCADEELGARLFDLEKSLVNRCNAIFTSAKYLSHKLAQRYGYHIESIVINNAIALPNFNHSQDGSEIANLENLMDSISGKKLLFLGAIAEWMDFDLILSSLERVPGITYVFVGPCLNISAPCHERIITVEPIEHRHIFRAMKKADALIMPFRINELIRSVDPVKAYDYIYSCKPAIVVGYGETEKFGDFFHLYRTPEEYMVKLEMLVADKLQIKKSSEECLTFIRQNTWQVRVAQMLSVINSLK